MRAFAFCLCIANILHFIGAFIAKGFFFKCSIHYQGFLCIKICIKNACTKIIKISFQLQNVIKNVLLPLEWVCLMKKCTHYLIFRYYYPLFIQHKKVTIYELGELKDIRYTIKSFWCDAWKTFVVSVWWIVSNVQYKRGEFYGSFLTFKSWESLVGHEMQIK